MLYKYNVPTKEEIVMPVSRLDKEDEVEVNELIVDEPAVPFHSEAYTCLSTCIWWLETQPDSNLVTAHSTLPSVSYNTTWQAAKLA